MSGKTALVLSAGGMFGAYQAGAWRALSQRFRPDLVIGASAGALNAWSIGGGCSAEELAGHWLDPGCAALTRYRLAQPPWRGCFDPRPLYNQIQALWAAYRPLVEVGVVTVELRRLKGRVFWGPEITWRHLAASCAVLLCFPQVRIEGRWYTDGGLLQTLPVWAAAEAGATRVLAIQALPALPSRLVRAAVGGFRALAPAVPAVPEGVDVTLVAPAAPLGSVREALFWNRDAAARWIAMGERDADRVEW